jgi:hypothetical protein
MKKEQTKAKRASMAMNTRSLVRSDENISKSNSRTSVFPKASKYILRIRVHDKECKHLFDIYDKECSVLIDESIISLLRKLAFMIHKLGIYNNSIDHTMLYIYTNTNYNMLVDANITKTNILNEIIDERVFNVQKQNFSLPIYTQVGHVTELDVYMTTIFDEIDSIRNFYFGKIDERLITNIFYNYISVYFPILDLQIYKNVFTNVGLPKYIDINSEYIDKLQYEIEQVEYIESDDLQFLANAELKNVFIIYTPVISSKQINNVESLVHNMIFLDDTFLSIFESIPISRTITSVILQTPQIVTEKGVNQRGDLHTAPHRITLKGTWQLSNTRSLLISYTVDLDFNKARVYVSYNGHETSILTKDNVDMFINHINSIFSKNDWITISHNTYTIDFFNVKVPILKSIEVSRVLNIVKQLTEYFYISKDSTRSIYLKYRIGYIQNLLSGLYNKLFALVNTNTHISPERMMQLRIEYQLDEDEFMLILNDVRMKSNSSYRERGISILISDAYINISGLNSISMNERICFVINRLLNISTSDKKTITNRNQSVKVINEYIQYVTHLDTFLKNKTDVYWCKSCQNYSNKIRKPIQYDEIPDDFRYDKLSNTHVNNNGHRIIEMKIGNQRVYFGCDLRRSNPNKYIGFIKTCSLCCFQEDQFTSESTVSQKKVASCWLHNSDKKIKENTGKNTTYIYANAKMIGDISIVPSEYADYFDDDKYLFKLISVGTLSLKPKTNELVFIDSQLVNPQMYMYSSQPYSVYFYINPFTYKLIDRHVHDQDTFAHTSIDDFIDSCKRAFNAFAPLNAYNIIQKHKHQNGYHIEKFSYIEDMNTCIFITNSSVVLAFIDRTLVFGEYEHMFDLKYINKYTIPKLDNILTHLNMYTFDSILVNTDGMYIGMCVHVSLFVLFQVCNEQDFDRMTKSKYKNLKKTTNVAIASIVNQELKLAPLQILITSEIAEMYIYNIFRYQLYVYFNMNPNIKKEFLDLICTETNPRVRRIRVRELLQKKVITHLFTTSNERTLIFSKLDIQNNIGRSYATCAYPGERVESQCKLKIPSSLQTTMINSVINELIFPYSSMYVYTSHFINNTYSQFYSMNRPLYSRMTPNSSVHEQTVRILNDGKLFIQEIYPFNTEMTNMMSIYRALANLYFWELMREETNITRRNLGYYSRSQTYLAHYIKSTLHVSADEVIQVLDKFNEIYSIDVSLQIDSNILRKSEINSKMHIYMSVHNGLVSNISIGIDLDAPT